MSDKQSNLPTNEEIINEITQGVNSGLSVNDNLSAEDVAKSEYKESIPENFEKGDEDPEIKKHSDDYVDEERLKDLEINLTHEEMEIRHKKSLELKKTGNEQFKLGNHIESINTYTEALRLCPLQYQNDRSIFYANRAASKISLGKTESALEDCTKAIELNDKYIRAYLRRAKLYEESDKLDESLADYKKVLEFDINNKDALQAQYRLPPLIEARNEKLKTEMLGKYLYLFFICPCCLKNIVLYSYILKSIKEAIYISGAIYTPHLTTDPIKSNRATGNHFIWIA